MVLERQQPAQLVAHSNQGDRHLLAFALEGVQLPRLVVLAELAEALVPPPRRQLVCGPARPQEQRVTSVAAAAPTGLRGVHACHHAPATKATRCASRARSASWKATIRCLRALRILVPSREHATD